MRWILWASANFRFLPSLCLTAVVFAGCVTSPRVDWDARVGNFTYDQAVIELGPPDKIAKLSDNTTVAEWLTNRGYGHGTITLYGPHRYGYGTQDIDASRAPDYFLRLVFNPEATLTSWKRFAK